MQPGKLRHRIWLQDESNVQNSFGEPTTGFVDVAQVYASIEPLKGREFFAAQQVQSETTHRIVIRYRPGVASHKRIRFGTRTFDIQSVINVEERNVEIHLMCVERMTSNA